MQRKQKETNTSTMATITASSNYWTATAHHVMPAAAVKQSEYVYDECGIKCRINPDDETNWQPCEPWCTSCGFPPNVCDEYFTRCTGTKVGDWFNEETGKWIEADAPTAQEKEEEERWNQHKYGLCPLCKIGLDDKSEFTFNYTHNKENGTMMCFDCDAKIKLNKLKLKLD
jgi:hypothetical protein